jgi:hypothetical protein
VLPAQTLAGPVIDATVGSVFTIIFTVVVEVQVPEVAVIVNVVVCWEVVVLVSVPVMDEPLPLAGIPVKLVVLFLVQLNVVPATALGLVILICVIGVPVQSVWVAGVALTVGLGFTLTVAVVVLEHPAAVAVIVNVVVCAVLVVFVNVPEMGDPVPLAAIPVRLAVLVRVQLNVVPDTLFGLVMTMLVIGVPEHRVWFVFVALTVGIGLTLTVTVVLLEQLPAVAVMVNVVVCTVFVVLVSVPVIDEPEPLAGIPVRLVVLFLVQLNVVPVTALGLVISICVMAVPEQLVWLAGVAFTVGLGFTLTVAVVVLEHPAAVAVMVNVVVCAVLVVFVRVPEIGDPVPLAAMPVRLDVLVLVQLNVVPDTAFGLVITILLIGTPEQSVWFVFVALTVGMGLTVTVTVVLLEHPAAVAVMVNVVVCCVEVLLLNIPEIDAPVPLAGIPVRLVVLVLVQLNVVPATAFGLVISICVIATPEHDVWVRGVALTVGPGFTVTVAVVVLEQPAAVAVMVNVVVCAILVVFVSDPEMGDPVPLAAIPVRFVVFVLVQLNVVPDTAFGLVITMLLIGKPEHTVWFVFVVVTVGMGLTVTDTEVVFVHVPAVAVIVKVVVWGVLVELTGVPVIVEPVPFAGIPVTSSWMWFQLPRWDWWYQFV